MGFLGAFKRRQVIRLLKNASDVSLKKYSEKLVLDSFKCAAKRVSAYKAILKENNIDPSEIKDIYSFRKHVPVLDKHNTFGRFDIKDLCVDGDLKGIVSISSSSGSSGVFSYSIMTGRSIQDTYSAHNLGLDYAFNVSKKKTLVLNCMGMGQRIYSDLVEIAEVGMSEESAFAIIDKFHDKYEQIVLAGNQIFIKAVIENGARSGIDWHSMIVHAVIGGEAIAENFRTYLTHMLGIDPDRPKTGVIISSGGIAELFLHSAFHETVETVRIRRLAHADVKLREAIFGEGAETCPLIFVYYPNNLYIEKLDNAEKAGPLLFSTVGKNLKMPLIRYSTGDNGSMVTHSELRGMLTGHGYHEARTPELKLPIVFFYPRDKISLGNHGLLTSEMLKEALYSDFTVAGSFTGYFRVKRRPSGIVVEVQLKKGKGTSGELVRLFEKNLAGYIKEKFSVKLLKFEDFTGGMRLNYEKKCAYMEQ